MSLCFLPASPRARAPLRRDGGCCLLFICNFMPLELQIIRASEFIRLGAHGHFDLTASKAALATLARACRKRAIDRALMDLRSLQPGPTPVFSRDDLIALVNTFPEVGFTRRQRLAILYQTDPHHRARLFAFLSTVHGWTVRAFDDFEKALSWLSSGLESADRPARSSAERPVPLRVLKREANLPTRPVSPSGRQGKGRNGRNKAAALRPGCARAPRANLQRRPSN
jgi:hypothetical protein